MVNKVILIGNLGADPEIHVFESGSKQARIRIATTERIYNPATTTWSEHTEWHSVIVGQRQANFVEMYIKKGSQVYVEGRIRRREWGDGDEKRFSYEIRADEIRQLGRRSDNGDMMQQSQPAQSQPAQSRQPQQSFSQTPPAASQPFSQQPQSSSSYSQSYNSQSAASQPESSDMTTDDLPF